MFLCDYDSNYIYDDEEEIKIISLIYIKDIMSCNSTCKNKSNNYETFVPGMPGGGGKKGGGGLPFPKPGGGGGGLPFPKPGGGGIPKPPIPGGGGMPGMPGGGGLFGGGGGLFGDLGKDIKSISTLALIIIVSFFCMMFMMMFMMMMKK